MYGSAVFARLRQCSPHATHASLGPPESITHTASRSVQPLLHSWWQSVFGHDRACFPLKLPLLMGDLVNHVIHASLGPSESITQHASQSVQPFLHSSQQSFIGDIRACPSAQNCPFPFGAWNPHVTRGSLGLPDSASKWHLDRVSRLYPVYSRQSLYMPSLWQTVLILYSGSPSPQNCPFPRGIWTPI